MDPLKVMRKAVPAEVYNQIRLAMLRGTLPLRVDLTKHRGLYFIIAAHEWLAFDELAFDQTVLAWREFEVEDRDNLVEPVFCELSLYHSHSGLVMGSVLDEVAEILSAEKN